MNRILDHLYLGASSDLTDATSFASDQRALAPCTAVLTLCEVAPPPDHGLLRVHYPIPDERYLPILAWDTAVCLIAAWLRAGETLLVHCRLGVSRSPAVVAAYLAWRAHDPDPETAMAFLKTLRPIVNTHPETWRGVTDWWDSHPRERLKEAYAPGM